LGVEPKLLHCGWLYYYYSNAHLVRKLGLSASKLHPPTTRRFSPSLYSLKSLLCKLLTFAAVCVLKHVEPVCYNAGVTN